jgi:HSP20 family protein
MNQLVDQFLSPEVVERNPQWFAPRSNVLESDKEYEITVDLPGMKADDIQVEIREGHLWIGGERKFEKAAEGKTYRRVGSYYGRFEETIPLEIPVNADKVHAEFKDGVLKLVVPKEEAAQPKRIEIKAAS